MGEESRKKCEEKTAKYSQLRWELKRQYPSYDIEQCIIVNDFLAAPTKHLPTASDNEDQARCPVD